MFSSEIFENFKNTYFEEHLSERLFRRILQEELLNSTTKFYILMNVYRFFEFLILGSVSQHGTLQQIMGNASPLHMTQLVGKEPNNFQQVSKSAELKFISTT